MQTRSKKSPTRSTQEKPIAPADKFEAVSHKLGCDEDEVTFERKLALFGQSMLG